MKHDGTYLLRDRTQIKRDGFKNIDAIEVLGITIGSSNPNRHMAFLSPPTRPEKICKQVFPQRT